VTYPAHAPSLENLNAVWLLWLEPPGCPAGPPGSVSFSVTLHRWQGAVGGGDRERRGWLHPTPLRCCAPHLRSAPVRCSSLTRTRSAPDWPFSPSCCIRCPLGKARAKRARSSSPLRSVHPCWLLWREQEGVGAGSRGGPQLEELMRGLDTHSSCEERPLQGGSSRGAAGRHPKLLSDPPRCCAGGRKEPAQCCGFQRSCPALPLPRRSSREPKPGMKSFFVFHGRPWNSPGLQDGGGSPALPKPARSVAPGHGGSECFGERDGAKPSVGVRMCAPLERASGRSPVLCSLRSLCSAAPRASTSPRPGELLWAPGHPPLFLNSQRGKIDPFSEPSSG